MKRSLYPAIILAAFLCLTGCSDKGDGTRSDELPENSVAKVVSAPSWEQELEERDRSIKTDGKFVYDDDVILTTAEYDSLNSYTAWFSKTFKMSAAVVLTNDIGDDSPDSYAENFYKENLSGDGILILLNNDTNEDVVLRKGLPSKYISDSRVQMLLSEVSPMLALGDYLSAAETILEDAELSIPEYFTDRSESLEPDDVREYDYMLKEASSDGKLSIYYVLGTGSEKMEDFAKKRFDTFFDADSDTAFLVIDGENGESFLVASGKLKYMSDKAAEVQEEVKAAYKKGKGVDLSKAVEAFVSRVK